jgi:tetratricopeptide (TPR) repeat protein
MSQQSNPAGNERTPRTIKVFICYRRDDASAAAEWMHALLQDHVYPDRGGAPCKLDVYFDRATPGVADWKLHHEPSMQSAQAFLVICSPGLAKDFSKDGLIDWAHRELSWWMDNHGVPPILVDLTEDERWIPDKIRRRWPHLNRFRVDPAELQLHAPNSGSAFAVALRHRIVSTILESEEATNFEEVIKTRKLNTRLRIRLAVAVLACVAALFAWWRAVESQRVAETQREVARHSVAFLTHLFASADPDSNSSGSLTVSQLLKVAPASIESAPSTVVKAHLLRTMGGVHTGLADYKAAIASLKQAETLFEKEKIEDEDRFRLAFSLGEAYLYSPDDFDEALPYLERAHSLAESHGVSRLERASVKGSLGDYFAWSAPPEREKAQTLYEEALAIDRSVNDPIAIARELNRLGVLALESQRSADARRYLQESVDALANLSPEANALFAAKYEHDLAAMLYEDGTFTKALESYSRSSDAFKRTYGDTSIEYATAENNVARILLETDQLDNAGKRIASAVKIESESKGADFYGLALAGNTHALTLRANGNREAAKLAFENAVRIATDNDMAIAAQSLVHLAELELSGNDTRAAEAYLAKAHEHYAKHEIDRGWRYALYQSALGELRIRQCRMAEASDLLKKSGEVLAKRWPTQNIFTRAATARQQALEQKTSSQSTCSAVASST